MVGCPSSLCEAAMPRDQETSATILAFRAPAETGPRQDRDIPVIMERGWYHQEAIEEDRSATVLNVDFKRD